ncbi:ImmA/IrrE family metallo-endopeptidase [Marimonas arenosa]|uniref:ImmA/IrrE family metallo-endopeptidase n=1 Tax=Marimonas arenosa TaxID=1795305 RepID=A0AAE3W8Y9_9RHOB|nr:ImmA/IrrE family metallo-endopeptidase [Marimonas arenosa]MDQ2088831.1 ImmA/IrrE family metallo-endopeptidase [Marimonas arenosa]
MHFKSDNRIDEADRKHLRSFASSAGQHIHELAMRLGLRIDEEELPDDVSAVLIKSPNCGSKSGFRIVVNARQSFERRRLSVAHEIAHYVLHRNEPDFVPVEDCEDYGEVVPFLPLRGNSYRSTDTRGQNRRLELEANAFATCLLMPEHLIRKNASYRVGQIRTLARDFQVSFDAMRRRVEEIHNNGQAKGSLSGRAAQHQAA